MLCTVCRGAQNLISFIKGIPHWWQCPGCGGAGVHVQGGPAAIGPGTRRTTSH